MSIADINFIMIFSMKGATECDLEDPMIKMHVKAKALGFLYVD